MSEGLALKFKYSEEKFQKLQFYRIVMANFKLVWIKILQTLYNTCILVIHSKIRICAGKMRPPAGSFSFAISLFLPRSSSYPHIFLPQAM